MGDYIYHHGIQGQKWGVRNGPPYPLSRQSSSKNHSSEDFDPFEAMSKIDKSLSKKEQDLLGVGNDESTDDMKFFFNKDKTAYLLAVDYHGKYKDEHPIDGKILGIAAMPQARGTGATDKLISDAKKEFKNDRLVAEIDQGNTASKKLFERNDFKKIMEENGVDYYIYGDRKSKLVHGFLCEIELDEDTLTHYGVKGMKWRYRKRSGVDPNSAYGRLMARNDIESLVDRAKLVGKKGSSSKTSKAKGAGKKAAAGSKAAKKETEKKSAATTNPLQERIESIKKQKVDKDYISALKNNLSRDRSQLPKAREKAIELEKRKKKR